MTFREAAIAMRISQNTLQKLVHRYKFIRYVERFNSQNQRIFDLSGDDIRKLISMKDDSGMGSWRSFLTLYTHRDYFPVHTTQFIKDVDEEFVRTHLEEHR